MPLNLTHSNYPSYKCKLMQNAESHAHILFFVQLKACSPYRLVPKPRMCPPHPQLDRGQSFLQERIHVPVFNLWYNYPSSSAGMRPHIGHLDVVRQKPGSPSPQPKGPHQSVGVHGEDEQKKCEKGWKWVKVGENPKMPYPPCGRSIKTYARGNNDAPSITKYGSPVRLDTQIVGLRPHCARTALRAPPFSNCALSARSLKLFGALIPKSFAAW